MGLYTPLFQKINLTWFTDGADYHMTCQCPKAVQLGLSLLIHLGSPVNGGTPKQGETSPIAAQMIPHRINMISLYIGHG